MGAGSPVQDGLATWESGDALVVTAVTGNPDYLYATEGTPGGSWETPSLVGSASGISTTIIGVDLLVWEPYEAAVGWVDRNSYSSMAWDYAKVSFSDGAGGWTQTSVTQAKVLTMQTALSPDGEVIAAAWSSNWSPPGRMFAVEPAGSTQLDTFDLDELLDLAFAPDGDAAVLGVLAGELVLLWWDGVTWTTEGLGVAADDADLEFTGAQALAAFEGADDSISLYAGVRGEVGFVATFEPDPAATGFSFCTDDEGLGFAVTDADGLWMVRP